MPDIQANPGPTPPSRTATAVVDSSDPSPKPAKWPAKDPDEVLDYALDWSPRLAEGDTIEKSEWVTQPTGLLFTHWFDNTVTRLWIRKGVPDTTYFFTNRVLTVNGRWMDQTVTISVVKSR